jgi:2-oxoglutarate ferredoxin oxidoreductase subunit beta
VGYTIIEVISTCPTNWGLAPNDALQWMRDNMLPYYPLGVFKDVKADGFESIADAAVGHDPAAHGAECELRADADAACDSDGGENS